MSLSGTLNITFGLNTEKQGGHGKEGPQHLHPGVGVVVGALWLLDTTQLDRMVTFITSVYKNGYEINVD